MGTKVFDNFMYGYEKKLRVWKFHSAHTPGIKNERSLRGIKMKKMKKIMKCVPSRLLKSLA